MLSYKAAHGMFMFMTWINITGRLVSTRPTNDFTCYTYPVYKMLDSPKFKGSDKALTYVPIEDHQSVNMPWAFSLEGWGVIFSIGVLLFAAVVGASWVKIVELKKKDTPEPTQPESTPGIQWPKMNTRRN